MSKRKIKKTGESTYLQKSTFYKLSKSFYEVDLIVYSEIHRIDTIKSIDVYSVEVQDIETNFIVDGKNVQYGGFKELYEKLFGKETYATFLSNICDEVEKHHLDSISELTFNKLSTSQLKKAWNDLYDNVDKNTWEGIEYADNWYFLEATKVLYPHAVETMDIPHAHGKTPKCYNHSIVNIGKL
jgi:hypothetical protein